MRNVLARCASVLLMLLAVLLLGPVQPTGPASAADPQLAAASGMRPLYAAPEAVAKPDMTPLPKKAQARCPGGQLVFLSRACGCNGACCLCSREAPYLNHCTCRCEAVPTPCAQGHSAGRP
jgi:hypothetical protein